MRRKGKFKILDDWTNKEIEFEDVDKLASYLKISRGYIYASADTNKLVQYRYKIRRVKDEEN